VAGIVWRGDSGSGWLREFNVDMLAGKGVA